MMKSFSLAFFFFLLLNVCLGQIEQQVGSGGWEGQQQQQQQQQPQRRFQDRSECMIQNLNAQQPNRQVQSEAGVTEFYDQTNEQFQCAGVAATRYVIQSGGLLLPTFENAPRLYYIVQGRGMTGAILPGCPETYHSIQPQLSRQRGSQQQRSIDQHQKIREFRQGDIVALPAGVAHWCYNEGETPLVIVAVHDTSSSSNQLDRNLRMFQLAGGQQTQQKFSYQQPARGQQQMPTNNMLSGFDVETLAESFGVSMETARKLQSLDDKRGNIVRIKGGLQVIRPPTEEEEEQVEQQWRKTNGLEETMCNMRLSQNIADPTQSDVYSENGGHITTLNSQKLPILNSIRMSAERGVLYRNAFYAPHWNLNAHSVIYVTRGSARVQVVGSAGRRVFDGELREQQMLVVPQNFAVVKQATEEGFEWIAFKTNDNAMISPLAGTTSALRAMPVEVLMNAYKISRDEANRLKHNRGQETMILTPSSTSKSQQKVASA